MAEFSGKIVDVYYFDDEHSTINVEWKNDEGKLHKYFVKNDPRDSTFQELVAEGYTDSKILDGTVNYRKRSRKAFEQELVLIATREGLLEDNSEITFNSLASFLFKKEDEIDQESLFKFKLQAFDHELLLNSENTEAKKEIRKATTYVDILKVVLKLAEE